MAQKVFSSQTPAGCLAHPMGGLHPALEITDPKDGLKLKTEKQGKNQEKKKKKVYSLASMCSTQEVKGFESLVPECGMNSLRSWRLSQRSSYKCKQDFFNQPLWYKSIATYTLKKNTQIIKANHSANLSPGAEEGRTNNALLNALLKSSWVLLQRRTWIG